MALRSTFRPEAAVGAHVGYELRFGEIVLHARINDGRLDVARGPLPDADLVIETGPALKSLLNGELAPARAIESDCVRLHGDPALLERFVQYFRIEPLPSERSAAMH